MNNEATTTKTPEAPYLDAHPWLLELEVVLIDVRLLVLVHEARGRDLDEAHVHEAVLVLGGVQSEGEGVTLAAREGELAGDALQVGAHDPGVEGAPEGGRGRGD